MKCLIVSQYFYPENFKVNDIALHLAQKNEVIVLTGHPNYPNRENFKNKRFSYDDYKKIQIIRVPIFFRSKFKFLLPLNYFSFLVMASLKVLTKIRKEKIDRIFFFGTSPFFSIIPAILLKKINKAPITIWVLDLWPQTLDALGIIKRQSLIYKILNKLINKLYGACDNILVSSKGFLSEIEAEENKKFYLPNWSDNQSINNITRKKELKKKVFFAGNLGSAQSLDKALIALSYIKDKPIEFHLVGDGSKKNKLLHLKEELKLNNVFFHDQVPSTSISNLLKDADAFYISLKKSYTLNLTLPGKFQTYLSYGKPILASISGETSELIEEYNLGYTAQNEDIKGIVKIFKKLLKISEEEVRKIEMQSKRLLASKFSKACLLEKIEHIIKS